MTYDGGKGGAGVYQWIISQIPPHRRFVSLFLGNCAVMRFKRPAEESIGVELSGKVIQEYWSDARGLTVIHGDAAGVLDTFDWRPDDFCYCDPPYLMSTRSCQKPLYAFELADEEQHRDLLARLQSLPCMVAVSGYWSELYAELLPDWRTSNFWTVNRAGARVQEWLWMNYSAPFELHDYRYLGGNYRKREQIKRKKARWVERLRRMPDLERLALMEAIGEVRGPAAGNGDIDEASPDPLATSDDGSWPASPGPAMVDQAVPPMLAMLEQ